MNKSNYEEGILTDIPYHKENGASLKKVRRNRFFPYKLALFACDFAAINLVFGIFAWVTGFNFYRQFNSIQFIGFLVLSLMLIVFFPAFNLYNYHYIFSRKNHLGSLIRSFGWSLLSLCIVTFFSKYPHFLEGLYLIPLILLAAIGLLVLSRFTWDYLLNVLKSVGLSFLVIAITDLANTGETAIIIGQWFNIPIVFLIAFGLLFMDRSLLVHVIFNNWMRRRFRQQMVIVGSDQEAKRITSYIINKNAPFWIAGFVSPQESDNLEITSYKNRLGELEELPKIVEEKEINEIIVTDENIDQRTFIALLDYCISKGLTVWFSPKLLPIIDSKLYIDSFFGLPMISLCTQKNKYVFTKIKYAFDSIIVLPALLFLSLFFLIIAAAIKMNSHGPVFYRAKAIGEDGRMFDMYKFRSMRSDSGNEIHKDYVSKFINGRSCQDNEKDGVFKITDDPRVTSIGKKLRKFSIDELPQLINVLKGEMSLVGPRPCLPYEYEAYKDWHRKRLSIRPGITCFWQVAGRSAVSFEDMVLLDLYYIYNRNLLMDINILYETIFAVLGEARSVLNEIYFM